MVAMILLSIRHFERCIVIDFRESALWCTPINKETHGPGVNNSYNSCFVLARFLPLVVLPTPERAVAPIVGRE